ncbi:hypothetical protein [Acrocarpospora catenulata]|uniref:hypothetical protein n=1 Tax=Acrocarpospora catenulata TaxID=2836182 RepID=UPI001BDA16ED|nr:hypothetical protein [Acrocarpospora catenulata]
MRAKMMFAVGLGLGYVLGTRAGRERYEQIVHTARRISDDPRVQEAAGLVRAKVSSAGTAAKDMAADKMGRGKRKEGHWEREKVTSPSGAGGKSSPTGWPETESDRVT